MLDGQIAVLRARAIPNRFKGSWIAAVSIGRDKWGNEMVRVVSSGHATETAALKAAVG